MLPKIRNMTMLKLTAVSRNTVKTSEKLSNLKMHFFLKTTLCCVKCFQHYQIKNPYTIFALVTMSWED